MTPVATCRGEGGSLDLGVGSLRREAVKAPSWSVAAFRGTQALCTRFRCCCLKTNPPLAQNAFLRKHEFDSCKDEQGMWLRYRIFIKAQRFIAAHGHLRFGRRHMHKVAVSMAGQGPPEPQQRAIVVLKCKNRFRV